MNPAALIAHYDKIADAEDAIPRLRRFILDLAVRGKLVPQDAGDEPAGELLKRIAVEKARLVKAGSLRPAKNIRGEDIEVKARVKLPASWSYVRIVDVGQTQTGTSPSSANSEFFGNFIPFIKPGDLDGPQIFYAGPGLSEIGVNHSRIVKADSVLMVCIGATLGKVNITSRKVCFNQQINAVSPFITGLTNFIALALKSTEFQSAAWGCAGTGTLPIISKGKWEVLTIPFPPLAEQHRIVAKVDELMGLCDRLAAARDVREGVRDALSGATLAALNTQDDDNTFKAAAKTTLKTLPHLTTRPNQIKALRQTILNLAVRGKLVPQDAGDEPASELLKRLLKTKIELSNAEGLRTRPQIMKLARADLWFEFPSQWALSSFDELFVIVSGVTKGQKVDPSNAVEAPYLRVANVQRGYLDLSTIKMISIRSSDFERYTLRNNDVLMTEGGDWDKLGRAAIWREEVPNCIHQNHIFRVRPPESGVNPKWITTYVNSLLGRAFFEDASKQTTNLASINMTQLRGCPFPLPPLAEQHRIVAKVDELMARCDALETNLKTTTTLTTHLLDALLAQALEGAVAAQATLTLVQGGLDSISPPATPRPATKERVRFLVASQIVERLASKPTFGRTQLQKHLHLAQYHLGIDGINGEFRREAAGPLDWPMITSVEEALAFHGFATTRQDQKGWPVTYKLQPNRNSYQDEFAALLGPEKANALISLLDAMAEFTTQSAEAVSTLYAAWNDFLIDGTSPTDEDLFKEIRTNWHPQKDIPRAELIDKLDWMHRTGVVPKGHGPKTIPTMTGPLL